MNVLVDTYAVAIIAVILVLFIGIFLVLIFYATIHRVIMNRRATFDRESDERIEPLIYDYLVEQISRKDFSDELVTRYDVAAAYRHINTMIDNIGGPERERLQSLLEVAKFRQHFFRKLRSSKPMNLAQACIYFSQKALTDKNSVARLSRLQDHPSNVIAYASTLALVNATDRDSRDAAVKTFLHRQQNASMAISDIIFKYHEKYPDKEEVAEKLMFFVMDPAVPDRTRSAVISMFPGFGFYHLSGTLYELMLAGLDDDSTGTLTATLIRVLHELSLENLSQHILHLQLWRSRFPPVRLEVARVFSDQPDVPPLAIMMELAHDSDLEVRMTAQRAMLKPYTSTLPDEIFAPGIRLEWLDMKQSGEAHVHSF